MTCTVVDIWGLWTIFRDVPDLFIWETSVAWGNVMQCNWICSRIKWHSYNESMLGTVQISVLFILNHPYKMREWCFKNVFDISFHLPTEINYKILFVFHWDRVKRRLRISENSPCMLMCQRKQMNLFPGLRAEDVSSKQSYKIS